MAPSSWWVRTGLKLETSGAAVHGKASETNSHQQPHLLSEGSSTKTMEPKLKGLSVEECIELAFASGATLKVLQQLAEAKARINKLECDLALVIEFDRKRIAALEAENARLREAGLILNAENERFMQESNEMEVRLTGQLAAIEESLREVLPHWTDPDFVDTTPIPQAIRNLHGIALKLESRLAALSSAPAEPKEDQNALSVSDLSPGVLSVASMESPQDQAVVADPRREAMEQVCKAARLLSAKLSVVHADPKYMAVWQMYAIHGATYTGPTYTAELAALNDALAALDKEATDVQR